MTFNSFGLTVFRQSLKYNPPGIGLVDAPQPIKNALPLLYNNKASLARILGTSGYLNLNGLGYNLINILLYGWIWLCCAGVGGVKSNKTMPIKIRFFFIAFTSVITLGCYS